MNDNAKSPRLILNKFTWERETSNLTIPFSSGLNIIHGKTQAERTILLRLIRYALGGKADRIDDAILNTSENVILEFQANQEDITVVRSCKHPSGQFNLFDSEGKHTFTSSDMSAYLINTLEFPKIYLPTTRPDGSKSDVPLSFSDLARSFVVDRDISYSGIMAGAFDRTIQETVKVMIGLTSKEVAATENQIRDLTAELSNLRQSIASIQKFLSSLDVPGLSRIENREVELVTLLDNLQKEEKDLKSETREYIEQAEKLKSEISYRSLREALLLKRKSLDEKQRDLLNIKHVIREKRELLTILEEEALKIERHLSSHHVISTFSFTVCPRCMQEITKQMVEKEQNGNCMLCGRILLDEDNKSEGLEKGLRDARQSIIELNELLINYYEQEKLLSKEIPVLSVDIGTAENKLDQEIVQYVGPTIERLQLIAIEKIKIERELSQLELQKKQREMAIHYEEVDLPNALSQLGEVNQQLELLKISLGNPNNYYNAFLSHFRLFLTSLNLDQQINSLAWDEKSCLPLINGQSYKIMIGFDLVLTVLAFHYALLAMGVDEPKVRTGHPKFIIVDEPEQQKMGKDRYLAVMKLFSNLGIRYKNDLQIIIATETKDIPQDLESYAFGI
ncbi:MAG TPA: AAA family ATPase [Bellilinea sp.]|nr:AAA family ATPase [Bellilinea sp.]